MKLAKNTGYVLFSGLINKLFSLVFVAYAARVLGPSDFGVFVLVNTVVLLFSFFSDLGMGPMAIREISKNKARVEELFNHVLTIRVLFVFLSFPLLVLMVNLLGYKEETRLFIYIMGITGIFSTFSSSFRILYVSFERFKVPSLISVLVSVMNNVICIIALYLGYRLKGVFLVLFMSSLLGAVIAGIWVRLNFFKYRFSFDRKVWKELLSESVPFAVIQFLHTARMQMNVLFLSKLPGPMSGELAIGYYNPAASVCQASVIVSDSFRQAALPTIASNSHDRVMIKRLINKSTKTFLVFIILPLVLLTTFFPKEIITIIFGVKYLPSAPALTILGWAYSLMIFNTPVIVTLAATQNIKRFIPWAVMRLIVNIVVTVPLILYYSYKGAAVAMLISGIIDYILMYYFLKIVWGIKLWQK